MRPDESAAEPRTVIRVLATAQLTSDEVVAIRGLLWAAFPAGDDGAGFTEDDWHHALGGHHVLVTADGRIVAHAAVVGRPIEFGGRRLRTGYVEAVATAPDVRRRGHGTRAMLAIGELIRNGFEIGMLGTGEHGFYERIGWTTWRGPSFLRTDAGLVATPDDDGYLMVLRTPSTPELDPGAPVSCDWRDGDVW
jgi:aminoglycoside 2'-N-acetyltransferase I